MKTISSVIIVVLQATMALSFLCNAPLSEVICPNASAVRYNLYTENSNTYTEIFPGNLAGITHNVGCPFIFITHGWTDYATMPWILDIITEIFKKNTCYNVIGVDWSEVSSSINYTNLENYVYPYPAFRTCCTGEYVGELMMDLNVNLSISYDSMYFVGHSMGAHLAGCAGQYVVSKTGQHISRVTGLDPAGPMFTGTEPNCRLSPDDAAFVDAIHTDRLEIGYPVNIAQMDFYPNGGAQQPGCPYNTDATVKTSCNHLFSIRLYTATINTEGFKSNLCSNYITYEASDCFTNSESEMGFSAKKGEEGGYYLDTLANAPFEMNGKLTTSSLLSTASSSLG